MAIVTQLTRGGRHVLGTPHRVGRSRTCHLRLRASDVSAEHALFRWTQRWTLRDLGSRNGTWVNGERLPAGVLHSLEVGDVLGWGSPEGTWRVDSVTPPSASASCGDRIVEGDGDLLAIPSVDDPRWVAQRVGEERWEGADGPVADGDAITLGEERWTLRIPESLPSTRSLQPDAGLSGVSLELGVSRDEEYVEVTVHLPAGPRPLPPRSHHYLLLTLARARQQDRAAGIAEADAGWLDYDALTRMVKLHRNHVYVGIHRLRKEMVGLGVPSGDGIVERRDVTQQIRIGVADVVIRRLA